MPPPPFDDDLQLNRREFLVTAGAAVFNATGRRIRQLPITPDVLL